MIKRIGLILGALVIAGAAAAQQLPGLVGHPERELVNPDPARAPAGGYEIDTGHTAVIGRINHGNLSFLYFFFDPSKTTGRYVYDPANPTATRVEVTIDPATLTFAMPMFDLRVRSAEFLDVARYPIVRFVSTEIKRTDMNHGTMTGNLTLHGVTKPITLDVTFNGAGPAGRRVKMGFSATADLLLADYGIDVGLNNVTDGVSLIIETEFSSVEAATVVDDVLRFLQGQR